MKIGDLVRPRYVTFGNTKFKAGSVGLVIHIDYDDPDDPTNSHAQVFVCNTIAWWQLDYLEVVK